MRKLLSTFIIVILFFSTVTSVFAEEAPPPKSNPSATETGSAASTTSGPSDFYTGQTIPTSKANLSLSTLKSDFLPKLTTGFSGFIAAVAVIFIIVAGIKYLLAMGSPEEITKAHKSLLWIILGLGLTMFAYGIVFLLINFFG